MIEDAYSDVTVIYTRSDDRFVELHTRGDIANKANADLFISIHTDAVGNNEAHGSSTYIMGNDKSEKNLAVAQRENSVIVMEGDYEEKYEGYDPSSAESFIIFSLMQYAYSEQSMIFAEMIQKHYKLNTPIVDRGARQGPYLVLWRTAMPAVLTEMGFMTNKGDRDYLHSEVGQKQVAKSLFDAFSEYRTRVNSKAEQVVVAKPVEVAQPTAPAPKQEVKPAPTPKQESKPAPAPVVKEESAPKCYVQICTLSKKSDPNDRKFGKWAGRIVQKQTSSGKWRCLIPASSTEEARAIKAEAEKVFAGAYIVKE
jgi:N-acetylmuramoyl-L-alanine amidase